jgi:ketosteroid isomerase-like protein
METPGSRIERLEIRLAITDLNNDFCHYLDYGQVEELVDLFTENCVYSHGNRVCSGKGEIRALFSGRIAKGVRTSRHLQTGLKITMYDEQRATGKSVCLTFACDQPPPISPATPFLVADFIDEYFRSSDGRWRIHQRHIERIFTADENKGPVTITTRKE